MVIQVQVWTVIREVYMRDIKFRGWYTGNSRKIGMYYDLQSQYDESPLPCPCFGDLVNDDSELVVMQYIGLKDKNGVDIYEGDIFQDEEDLSYDFVEWDSSYGGFTTHHWWGPVELAERSGYKEVIGNIHENPELLEIA